MCVLTIPEGVLGLEIWFDTPVDRLPDADVADGRRDSEAAMESDDCAAAKPMRADTMTDLENILTFMELQRLLVLDRRPAKEWT